MKVNYVLMYGIPYVRYKEFETFEDISKFLVHKGYVNYSIFKKLEDKEEIEMIYRDNDIHYLENFVKEQDQKLQQKENIIKEVREYIEKNTRWFDSEYAKTYGELCTCAGANDTRLEVLVNPSNLLKILDKTN